MFVATLSLPPHSKASVPENILPTLQIQFRKVIESQTTSKRAARPSCYWMLYGNLQNLFLACVEDLSSGVGERWYSPSPIFTA